MGVGVEAISRIERGVSVPSITRLAQIAEILDCSLQELINESSPIASDQALHLTSMITKLDEKDRSLVIGLVESLSSHLSKK